MRPSSARTTLPGTGKPHECPTCGRRVADKRSLHQHVAAAHPVAEVAKSDAAKGRDRRGT